MTKKDRLNFIVKIINEQEVSNQEELTEILLKNGFEVSQATVSRDINELNLIKVEGINKKFKYFLPEIATETPQKIIDLFKNVTTSIHIANNLIVVKTLAGNAGTAGMAIDHMKIPLVLGTIAGDDVLLIITKTNGDAEVVAKSLRSI
ncbi:MAG: arginine repressor [Clostridia bacterium]|nr:arginine repressor [Clostridia bacterium]